MATDSSPRLVTNLPVRRTRQATLATRNIKDFEETGVGLVNPWHVG